MAPVAAATPIFTAVALPRRSSGSMTVAPASRAATAVAWSSAITISSSSPEYPFERTSSSLLAMTASSL